MYIGVGQILGGVNNHIKAFMLHPFKYQRALLIEGPQILALKVYWGEHWLSSRCINMETKFTLHHRVQAYNVCDGLYIIQNKSLFHAPCNVNCPLCPLCYNIMCQGPTVPGAPK